MASRKELLRQIDNVTECPICSESFKEPKVLPCIHTFCLKCLDKYGEENDPGDKVNCPLCRQVFTVPSGGFKELPNNYFIMQLLQVNRSATDKAAKKQEECEVCLNMSKKSAASAFCMECSEHLCESCHRLHKAQKSTKMHEVVNLNEKPAVRELQQISTNINNCCDQHPSKEIEFFCYDCKKAVCMACNADHKRKQHRCGDIEKSAEEFRRELLKDIERVAASAHRNRSDMKQLEDERNSFNARVETVREGISLRCDQLRSLLDQHQSDLMAELDLMKNNQLKEFETRKDELERQGLLIENFKRYCEEISKKGTACEISRTASDLQKRANELVTTQGEFMDTQGSRSDITFAPSSTSAEINVDWIGQLSLSHTIINKRYPSPRTFGTVILDGLSVHSGTRCNIVKDSFTATSILREPTVNQVIKCFGGSESASGIAVLGNEIFVANSSNNKIEVYDSKDFNLIRHLQISDRGGVEALAACSHYNCLYVSISRKAYLHRLDFSNNSPSQWSLNRSHCCGLSVTRYHNLLVSIILKRIREYSTYGNLIREIAVASGQQVYHTIQLSTGNFVITHEGDDDDYAVSVIDHAGQVLKTYSGSGNDELRQPHQLAVDRCDNVIVADSSNSRLVLLSPTLKRLGYIETPGLQLKRPHGLEFDDVNHRLYITDPFHKFFIVLEANSVDKK